MPTTHAETINTDLLAFIRSWHASGGKAQRTPPLPTSHVAASPPGTWDARVSGGWRDALHLALTCGKSEVAVGRDTDLATVTPEHAMRAALSVITIVVLAVTGTALALGWEGVLTRRLDPVTVDAYVEGDRTPLSSHLSGYVRTVLVRDNQSVRAGDTIVQMVDDDYRAMAAEAQAQADATRAALAALGEKREVLQQQVVQAQDTVTAATDQLVHAVNESHRQQELLPTASGLLQSLQAAQADLRRAQATRAQAAAQVLVNQRQLDLLDAQILQAKAQTSEADAQNTLAQIALGYTRIAGMPIVTGFPLTTNCAISIFGRASKSMPLLASDESVYVPGLLGACSKSSMRFADIAKRILAEKMFSGVISGVPFPLMSR